MWYIMLQIVRSEEKIVFGECVRDMRKCVYANLRSMCIIAYDSAYVLWCAEKAFAGIKEEKRNLNQNSLAYTFFVVVGMPDVGVTTTTTTQCLFHRFN